MAVCSFVEVASTQVVGMAQAMVAQPPGKLVAVLGSCVGVALYAPRLRLAALAHVVLPHSHERDAPPAKFADTAVPHLVQMMETHGAKRVGLVAKIAGGSCMFGSAGPMQIGEANIRAVRQALQAEGVRLAGEDVGGGAGRRVTFCPETGSLLIESVGQPQRVLE